MELRYGPVAVDILLTLVTGKQFSLRCDEENPHINMGIIGGAGRARTDDPRIMSPML
jgi:hypothetical protein